MMKIHITNEHENQPIEDEYPPLFPDIDLFPDLDLFPNGNTEQKKDKTK